jgi:hypothetical protein
MIVAVEYFRDDGEILHLLASNVAKVWVDKGENVGDRTAGSVTIEPENRSAIIVHRAFSVKGFDAGQLVFSYEAKPIPKKVDFPLNAEAVEWVVNDNGELGVKIGEQFFFLYKGYSIVYGPNSYHSNGEKLMWRHVFKREFGECCHPIAAVATGRIPPGGGVSLSDSHDWKPIP